MNKKVILLYPYFNGISGAYNRYLLLESLIKITNFKVKLIILRENKYKSNISQYINKLYKFIKVEFLIIFYTVFKNYYLITDFNPSIIALFSKKVFVQIHDVSWENKYFARHNSLFYRILKFFIKYYSNILTVSKTSLIAIKKVSARNKRISYLYNSVNYKFIKESNNIGKNKSDFVNNKISKSIDLNLPNLLYIATLTPRKCHFEFLEALSRTNSLFNINLVGFPTSKKILDLIQNSKTLKGRSIKSKINYFPELSQGDLCTLLLYSSAYISTSINEGFGIPVLEAKLYNIPLIIRDIDINRELFPKARFFNSIFELTNILSEIKPLSKIEVIQRKKILSNINEFNISKPYDYLTLSKRLINIISDKSHKNS